MKKISALLLCMCMLLAVSLATAATMPDQPQVNMADMFKMIEALTRQPQTQPVVLRGDAIPAHIRAIMPGELEDGSYTDYGMGEISFHAESRIKRSEADTASFEFRCVAKKPEIAGPLLPMVKAQLQEEIKEKADELRAQGKKPAYIANPAELGGDFALKRIHKSVEMPWGVIYTQEVTDSYNGKIRIRVSASFIGLVELTQFGGSVSGVESEAQALEFINNVAGIAVGTGK